VTVRVPADKVADRLRREGLWRKLHNYLAAEAEMVRGLAVMRAKPYWLTVDPTSFCQLKCPFCPTGAGRNVRPKASLSLERFRALMRTLGPTLIHADFMNWGEPLLNKDIYAMVAEAKRCRVDTMLSTNLNAFGPESAEAMVRCGLDRVVLSVDGLSQETYSKYRVGGDFTAVVRNLRSLAEARRRLKSRTPLISWQFLVFKHNEHEVARVRETALSLGADDAGITPAYLPFRPGIAAEWLPSRPEHRLYAPERFPDSPPWHWDESAGSAPGERERDAPAEVEVEVYGDAAVARGLCNWPWGGIAVNADLSVSPCCSVEEKEYDFGSLEGRSFMELWNSEPYRRAREHVAAYARGRKESLPRSGHACERCFSIGRSRFQLPHHWLEGEHDG